MGRRLGSIFWRQTSATGNFVTVCFINMLLNFRWSIPAWLLLAARLAFGFPPLWVFFVVLAMWPVAAIVLTVIVRLLRRLAFMSYGAPAAGGSKVVHVDADTPSKNPYSATRQKEEAVKAGYSRAYEVEGRDWNAGDTQSEDNGSEMSQGAIQYTFTPQPASYPEVEGHDWYAEYMQSEEYKKDQNPADQPGRKSEFE